MSTSEQLTTGIDAWLRAEIYDSRYGLNSYLDDFDTTRRGVAFDVTETDALSNKKNMGHHGRYHRILSVVDSGILESSDMAVRKLVRHALMFTSGAFRLQCFLQASNQDEYEALRFGRLDTPNGATNISIRDTVERVEADELANNFNIKTYLELNRTLNDKIRDRHLSVAEWFADKPDLTMEPLGSDELPVKLALESQQDGLVLAASHLLVVASIRGTELGEVPIYGPKSISDAKEMKFSEVRLPRELLQ